MKKLIIAAFATLCLLVSAHADSTTTRFGITKPSIGSTGWGTKTNSNWDIIDNAAGIGINNTYTGTNTFSSTTTTSGVIIISTMQALNSSAILSDPITSTALSLAPSNGNRGPLFFATKGDYNHALFNNFNNLDSTVASDMMKWNEPLGYNFRLGFSSSKTPGLLISGDRVLTFRGALTSGSMSYGAALQEDPNNPITMPNSGGSAIAESVIMSPDGTTCYDWYQNNSNTHLYFATASDPKCQTWTLDGSSPLDVTNAALSGYTFYPQVLQSGSTYYMTVSTGIGPIALFQSTDGGHWSRYQTPDILTVAGTGHSFANAAIAVVGTTWHMLVEDYSGGSPFAHIYYSSATFSATMNFDTNFHSTPVFAGNTGNPVLVSVPDRSALLAIYGDINNSTWTLHAKYALLSSDLSLPASWVDAPGFFRATPGVNLTDPTIVFSTSPERGWGVMLHYNYAQFKAYAAYGGSTLDEFYDLVTAPTSGTSTVKMNLTGRMESDSFDVGHYGTGQFRTDSRNRLSVYTGPGYQSSSLVQTVLFTSYTATTADIPSNGGSVVTPTVAATTFIAGGLTASRAVTTDASNNLASSAVTATELGYVAGSTATIQTQMNLKAPLAAPALTGNATMDGTTLVVDSTNHRITIGSATSIAPLTIHTGTNQNMLFEDGPTRGAADGVSVASIVDNSSAYKTLNLVGAPLVLNATAGAGNVGVGKVPACTLDVVDGGQFGLGAAAAIRGTITPGKAGVLVYNSTDGYVCLSTGTTNTTWVQLHAPTTACGH